MADPVVRSIILGVVIVALTLVAFVSDIDTRGNLHEQARVNCVQIEQVKQLIREQVTFDPVAMAQTLTDVGIDPESDRGQRLIRRAQDNSVRSLARFKRLPCN